MNIRFLDIFYKKEWCKCQSQSADLCQKDGGINLRLQKLLSEVHCFKRKDVKVICNWIVNLPDELNKKLFTLPQINPLDLKSGGFIFSTYISIRFPESICAVSQSQVVNITW